MIFRYPAYYEEFSCIADRCEDTCCAGWEIDIDDESYGRYMSVEGELGEKLRSNIKEYEGEETDIYERHGFRLKEGKWCPFLDEKNLCILYRELGEDALCSVCTDTPRNYMEYGNVREVSVSASCPEAARLIYKNRNCITFTEKTTEEPLAFPGGEEELAVAEWIKCAEEKEIAILQNRERPLGQRILFFLAYAVRAQEALNRYSMAAQNAKGQETAVLHLPEETEEREGLFCTLEKEEDVPSQYALFLNRVLSFTGMESVNSEWETYLGQLNKVFIEPSDGEERYQRALRHLCEELIRQGREYEYEHLMVYYAFLFLPRCVDDFDFLGKAKMAVASFLMVRDIDAAQWEMRGGYTVEDRLKIVRIYAREVEHSEENLEYLADAVLFDEAYELPGLCKACRWKQPARQT